MDPDKRMNGLVTGIGRRLFQNDADITEELLKEKLFAGEETSFDEVYGRVTKMLTALATGDMVHQYSYR